MFDTFRTRSLLREHDDRLTTVERQLKVMQLEWTDTLDRLRSQLLRIRKERERIEAAEPDNSPPAHLSDEEVMESTGMTPHAQEVQAQILARRRRLRPNGGE